MPVLRLDLGKSFRFILKRFSFIHWPLQTVVVVMVVLVDVVLVDVVLVVVVFVVIGIARLMLPRYFSLYDW